jgi:hypothetical protein
MINRRNHWQLLVLLFGLFLLLTACGDSVGDDSKMTLTTTVTPTSMIGPIGTKPRQPQNPCEDLSGTLALQVLVGPAEAVGLPPVAIGEIPFSTGADGDPYLVEGGGPLNFYEELLPLEKGTYRVTFDGTSKVMGECLVDVGSGVLNMRVEFSGDQLVEVDVEGFQGSYPWSGTNTLDVTLPVVEGAVQEGEGWVVTLHINQ